MLPLSRAASAAPSPPTIDNDSVQALESVTTSIDPSSSAPAPPPAHSEAAAAHGPSRYEYRVVLACQPKRLSDTPDGEATNCSYAQTACTFRYPASDPRAGENLYRLEYRLTDNPSAPWALVREMCGLGDAPAGVAAPRIPSLGQIQTAFRQLPFSKPRVSVQPVGNVTLVNLPTFYQAVWPGDDGLQPGEVSRPVQLLSWSVEFRIAAQSYDFAFGDGARSGPVTDPGGGYPDGSVRHSYRRPLQAAQVKVDARLSAQYRANGGAWTDLEAVADLQGEPITVLQVKQAHARLVKQ
ncbi:hypothetical protein [Nostocoides sp. HKS02]|uniref:hypothetical protein n=1 Tax=Nostocoides sp. HKS02 TaxID=1813880 RepID=UPI0012B48728|nr:hypothetical protein [Tetrasphaera sp. HKS02]QGN57693.1 hypothetical protein GKE56_07170 [Tetrasphaera sp. HKS02]